MIARPLRTRWLLVGGVALLATSAAAAAPLALRQADSFRITHVEVRGTRFMAPQSVLTASGITPSATVFDDFAPWRARLLSHPLIAHASIERRLPGTIVIRVQETEPVAYARTPELVPIDARARALPVDPTAELLDVPVLAVASRVATNGRFADRATIDLAAAIGSIRASEPMLAAWISEAAPARGGGMRLLLRGPTNAVALLPLPLTAQRLRELRLALADLAARGELQNTTRVDARYRDQIVVTHGRGAAMEQS